MDYFVKRGDQQYGPYNLATLQQYVAQGSVSPQDLARSEGMNDWAPVSTIIGNVSAAPAPAFGAAAGPVAQTFQLPPKMHWGILLALGIVTLGIFLIIWIFVQAAWLRRVQPESRALYYLLGYLGAAFAAGFLGHQAIATILQLGGMVLFLIAVFTMRSEIEAQFYVVNPAGRSMSGVMTFFFNGIYFQYVLSELREAAENRAAAAATV